MFWFVVLKVNFSRCKLWFPLIGCFLEFNVFLSPIHSLAYKHFGYVNANVNVNINVFDIALGLSPSVFTCIRSGSGKLKTKVKSPFQLLQDGREAFDPTKVEQISWKPRYLYKNSSNNQVISIFHLLYMCVVLLQGIFV